MTRKCNSCGSVLAPLKYKVGDKVWVEGIVVDVDEQDVKRPYRIESETDWISEEEVFPYNTESEGENKEDTPDEEGWITWGAGECPVDGQVKVEVRFRNGETRDPRVGRGYEWDHSRGDYDIVAYRIAED